MRIYHKNIFNIINNTFFLLTIFIFVGCSNTEKEKESSRDLNQIFLQNPKEINESIEDYYCRLAANLFYENQYSLSLELYNKVLEIYPNNFDALRFSASILLHNLNKPIEACQYSEKLLSFYPEMEISYTAYSTCLICAGENLRDESYYVKAIDILIKGLSIFPESYGISFNLGSAYFRLKKYDEASKAFEKCAKKNYDCKKWFKKARELAVKKQENKIQ